MTVSKARLNQWGVALPYIEEFTILNAEGAPAGTLFGCNRALPPSSPDNNEETDSKWPPQCPSLVVACVSPKPLTVAFTCIRLSGNMCFWLAG